MVTSAWLLEPVLELSPGGLPLLPLLEESQREEEKRGLMAAALTAMIPTNWGQASATLVHREKGGEPESAAVTYGFANSPDGADVDTLDTLQGEDTTEQSGDNDEYAGTEKDANGKLAAEWQLHLPEQRQGDGDEGNVGSAQHTVLAGKEEVDGGGDVGLKVEVDLHDVEDHKGDVVGHGERASI